MKALALIALLFVGGCTSLSDSAKPALSDAEAISVARQYAAQHNISLKDLRPGVGRFDSGISVTFTDPACVGGCIDGLPLLFFIPAGQRRITHFQDGRV